VADEGEQEADKRDAKALGRWCHKHGRKFERVHLPNGAAVTGCPDCVTSPEFVSLVDNLITAAFAKQSPEDAP
jgi:hypothetical protein